MEPGRNATASEGATVMVERRIHAEDLAIDCSFSRYKIRFVTSRSTDSSSTGHWRDCVAIGRIGSAYRDTVARGSVVGSHYKRSPWGFAGS